MARRGIILTDAPPGAAATAMTEVNTQVLADLPTGQWEYVNVGGGRHVPANQLDPAKDWAALIQHPTISNRFAIPTKGNDAQSEENKGLRGFINAWDRMPQQAKDSVAGKIGGGRDTPNFTDDLTDELGADWFPEEVI